MDEEDGRLFSTGWFLPRSGNGSLMPAASLLCPSSMLEAVPGVLETGSGSNTVFAAVSLESRL